MTAAEPEQQPVQVTNRLYNTELYGNGRNVPNTDIHPGTEDDERARRIEAAKDRVLEVYPDVVGEYLAKELEFQAATNLRHDRQGMTMRLVEHVLAAPLPEPPAAELTVVAA